MKEKFLEYIKENYRETSIVIVVTAFALFLRLLFLQNYGELWLDELYSWYFANQKSVFVTVWELLKQDLHMPLYFVILHFWMKIFGKSDVSMHLCTLFLTIPLIPLSFYLVKNLFNKTAAYFSMLFLAISTFGIYYSIEVRFYGLVFVLSLLSAFFFVKMLENFEKKYTIGFIISHGLLLYTFSITPLLTFCYGIIGGFYLYNYKKDLLKVFCKNFLIIFYIAIPSLIFTLYNMFIMKTVTLCSFSKDIYFFKWGVILDILENFFTSENFQLITGNINVYRNLFENLHNSNYIIFVFMPVLICLLAIIRSLFSKNEKLILFLYPSFMFLILALLMGALGINSFITRYASIIYPVIICSAFYGLSLLLSQYKFISVILFSILIILNYSYMFVAPKTIYTNPRIGLNNLTDVVNKVVKPKVDDLFLIPYSGSKVMKYIPHGALIHFFADDALLLKDDESRTYYFDRAFYKTLDRDSVKEVLMESINDNHPFILYDIRLSEHVFPKMKKGQKFVIISYRDSFIMPLIQNWEYLKKINFEGANMFMFLMAKITRDSMQLAEKNLKFVTSYTDINRDYSIYVYEKP